MVAPIAQLFALRQHETSDFWGFFRDTAAGDGTATLVAASPNYLPPDGMIFWMHNLCVRATPGSGQAVTDLTVYGVKDGGIHDRIAASVGSEPVINWSGQYHLPLPEYSVVVYANFDAGTNNNRVELSVAGCVTRRGNALVY